MKLENRKFSSALLLVTCLALAACSGVPGSNSVGSSVTGAGSYTIGGTISGLTGTGLTLLDNGGNSLVVLPGSTTFTFTTKLSSGKTYAVTVSAQPTGPAQTCTVTAGSGTANANVTSVVIACTTNPVTATIGGTVTNLAANSAVILQDNGGDSLTVIANGPFQFKTPVTGPTDAYAVTVLTQPTTPNQICTVNSGSGTATGNVNNVAVNCVLSYTIGGTVTGLAGTGLILQDSATLEQLPISSATGNQTYTFTKLVPTGTPYTVSIFAQPTNPVQTCVVTPTTASGTATANVVNVAVDCPAVTFSIGGTVVGLAGVPSNNGPETDGKFVVEDALGNTITITENGPFTFATPFALNDQYEVSILHSPGTQGEGCTIWNYKGVVTANVSSIVLDCAHDDWTWIDGTKTAGTAVPVAPQYGSFPTTVPTTIPNPYTNTPGARYGAAGWTDQYGSLWLFGGDGWELSGNQSPDTLNEPMNDLWVCPMTFDYCQWQLVGGYDLAPDGSGSTVGADIIANAQHEAQAEGVYPGFGLVPGARVGAATWTDSAGNLWLFGGKTPGAKFINDLWKYDISTLNPTNYTTSIGQWTLHAGSTLPDQQGIYTGAAGTLIPGARVNPTSWTDAAGNFWLFGGYGIDGSGNLGYLNDLWEYKGGNWNWISGGNTNLANQNGVYGTPGTPSASNLPGGRHEAVGWADANGNLWLFGGEGEDSLGTPNGILNDLWMYNISSNQWTYVMGAVQGNQVGIANQTGVYELQTSVGPVNTTAAANTCGLPAGLTVGTNIICSPIATTGAFPGSRWGANGWTDAGGNFWLFGGWGLDSTATNGNGALNDLWVYTPNATPGQPGTWVWVKGSNTGSQNGIYGDLLRPYQTYYVWTPGGRSNATHWVSKGQFWLFGGEGYDSTSTTGNGYMNDMWRYLPYQDH
ncbi:MAG TPA: kelch repeat-containing protein [Candidatus Acidoferrum sp.]|nr:kelch repeat-containing protein [Candidatus Acidoferrum sp.]